MNWKSALLGAVKISILVGVLIVLGLKACLVLDPEPEAEVVLPAVVATALDDYAPVDAEVRYDSTPMFHIFDEDSTATQWPGLYRLSPDDHDATLEWALDRYAVLLRQVGDSAIVLDSLRYRIARCEVR